MKIVFIGGRDLHTIGGIEAYTRNLASQLVKMGHDVTVFCESAYEMEEDFRGIHLIHQRSITNPYFCKPILGLRSTWHVIRKLRDADIIHYNAWPPALWSPLARLFGIHSLMEGHRLEWKNTKYTLTERRIIRMMEAVTAYTNRNLVMCSESQTQYFIHRYGRRCFTLGSGTRLPMPDKVLSTDILDRLRIKPKKYFLLMSRLVSVKNPDILISAFKSVKDQDFRLVLAGEAYDQAYDTYLRRLAAEDSRVVFAGSVFGDDVDCLMREAYAFCNPSSTEGLSIALLEAMANRVPVIVSDIDGNREVLTDDTALWCLPRDLKSLSEVMNQAVLNPEYLRRGVESNYNLVVREYIWPMVAKKYLDYLHTLPHIRRKYGVSPDYEEFTQKSLYTS